MKKHLLSVLSGVFRPKLFIPTILPQKLGRVFADTEQG